MKKLLLILGIFLLMGCSKGQYQYLIDKDTGGTSDNKRSGCPAYDERDK